MTKTVMEPDTSVIERIQRWLDSSTENVFLRKEFSNFGTYAQVGRALRLIAERGQLVRVGYGVYVKAKRSNQTGNPIPIISLLQIGLEALPKLGVTPDLGFWAKEHMAGRTTQVPVSTVLNVGSSRIRRKLSFGKKTIRYEREPSGSGSKH